MYPENIQKILDSGRYALVFCYTRLCPYTDAILGPGYQLCSSYDTLEQAEAAALEEYYDGEAEVRVVSPRVVLPVENDKSDEVPF